jgi:FkbM family methyltransferase
MKSHLLPNGLAVKHLNTLETIHLYQDIFVQRVYLQHGITLPDNSVVIDGGANIGMFSLFVLENCPTATIHSFEPAPKTFEVLKANIGSRENVRVNNRGLGSHSAQEMFTFMPEASTASGYYDEAMLSAMKERMRSAILADPKKARQFEGPIGKELLSHHLNKNLKGQVVSSEICSISDYIDEQWITRIDLLKLDVECKELAVLSGIRDEHQKIIGQIVIEVHTRLNDPLAEVLNILEGWGFSVAAIPEEGLLTTMVYATRSLTGH